MCGKLKFKFETSCPPGWRLVDLLMCQSASRSLASQTSSLGIRGWRSTATITATCSWHSSCCPGCATCQAIYSSFNKTSHVHTGHATLRFLEQSIPAFIPPHLWPPNSTDINLVDYKIMGWHPASSAPVAAAQRWRAEEAFVRRLARHGPECHWRCNWRVA